MYSASSVLLHRHIFPTTWARSWQQQCVKMLLCIVVQPSQHVRARAADCLVATRWQSPGWGEEAISQVLAARKDRCFLPMDDSRLAAAPHRPALSILFTWGMQASQNAPRSQISYSRLEELVKMTDILVHNLPAPFSLSPLPPATFSVKNLLSQPRALHVTRTHIPTARSGLGGASTSHGRC